MIPDRSSDLDKHAAWKALNYGELKALRVR
jgi:hypothetical protein